MYAGTMEYKTPDNVSTYTEVISLDGLDDAKKMAVLVLMQEGALRERERILEWAKNNPKATKKSLLNEIENPS